MNVLSNNHFSPINGKNNSDGRSREAKVGAAPCKDAFLIIWSYLNFYFPRIGVDIYRDDYILKDKDNPGIDIIDRRMDNLNTTVDTNRTYNPGKDKIDIDGADNTGTGRANVDRDGRADKPSIGIVDTNRIENPNKGILNANRVKDPNIGTTNTERDGKVDNSGIGTADTDGAEFPGIGIANIDKDKDPYAGRRLKGWVTTSYIAHPSIFFLYKVLFLLISAFELVTTVGDISSISSFGSSFLSTILSKWSFLSSK